MTTFERRQQLISILSKQPGLRVPELAEMLDVSQGTIRNDLTALETEGRLLRVHGGATINEDFQLRSPSFGVRSKKNSENKLLIARWAAELVEDGDSILLDASTTVYYLARFLQNHRKLRVITNGIEVARALAKNPTNTVMLLGGTLNPDGYSLSGSVAEQMLRDFYIQTAFVSCSGFTPEVGLTEVHLEEAQVKSKAIGAARQVVALVDSSKFGKVDLTSFARLDQITHLFTDQDLGEAWVERLRQTNLVFSICDKEGVATITPGDRAKRRYRIGFANQSDKLPFAAEVRKSIERAAQKAGNVDLVLADNQLNPETALKVAERFLTQNLDLVIEYQIDEQMGNRIMSLFQDAHIPVISIDIPMIGATYFGVDNYRAGLMAGESLGKWVRSHWDGAYDRLIILEEPRAGAVPATRIRSQLEGFQSIVGAVPEGKCIRLNSGNTREVSERAILTTLKHFPDQHKIAVISFNDDAAMGALEAARKLDREEDIAIVGQGAERRVRQELARQGSRIIGSTTYSPEGYGERIIPLALRLINCEPVPPAVYMEHRFIDAENPA